MRTKKLSLVILTYNSERHIFDCLESVYKYNDIGDALEIIVVDNHSKGVDAMFQRIREVYREEVDREEMVLIKNDANSGYGEGNNVGIRRASAPYVMVMNPDVRLLMPVFRRALSVLERGEACMVGMKQWYVKDVDDGLSFDVDMFKLPPFLSVALAVLANRLNFYWQRYMYINGACFLIDKQLFEEIGLFDKRIFLYCEELDIYRRIMAHHPKHKIKFLKDCHYLHLAGDRDISTVAFQRQLESERYCAEKFGYSFEQLIHNKIGVNTVYIVMNWLKGKKQHIESLKAIRKQLKEELK